MAKKKNGNAAVTPAVAIPPNKVHYIGVRKKQRGRYGAEITPPGKNRSVWLGTFDTTEEAARAYDTAQRRYRGPRAKTNFPADNIPNTEDDNNNNNNDDDNNNNNHRTLLKQTSGYDHLSVFNTDNTVPLSTELDKYYAEVLSRAGVIIHAPANFSKGIVSSVGSDWSSKSGVQDQSPPTTIDKDHNIELNLELSLAPPGSI